MGSPQAWGCRGDFDLEVMSRGVGGQPRVSESSPGGSGEGGLARGGAAAPTWQQRPPQPVPCPAAFTGPPDPLHGTSLYQKVRAAAQVSPGPTSALGPQLPSRCGTRALCVALRGGGTVGRVATLSTLTSCLGLGEHLVLGHPVPAASLAASQGPAASRYAACPASHGVLPREGAWGPPPPVTQSSHRHGLPVQAPERPPGLRLQQGAGPHR